MSKPLSWILWRLTRAVSMSICHVLSLCCPHSQVITFDIVELWISCDWQLKSRMCHIGQPLSEAVWLMTKHISSRQKWNHALGDWKKWHNLAGNKNLPCPQPVLSTCFPWLFSLIHISSFFLPFPYEKLTSFWKSFPYKHVMMLWYAFPHILYFLWLKVLRCVKNYAKWVKIMLTETLLWHCMTSAYNCIV